MSANEPDGWVQIPADRVENWTKSVEDEFLSEAFYQELMSDALRWGGRGSFCDTGRRCLFVLGPSATGKTHTVRCIADGRLPIDSCYKDSFVLDGARFRDTSRVWTRLKAEAIADGHTGYANGYDTCMKKATDSLKAKLTERLLNDGSNLIIPDTCSNAKSVIKKANMLRDAGYTLDVLVVVAPKNVCIGRGTSREQFEGKKYSCKNWQKSMEMVELVINDMRDNSLSNAEFVVVDSGGDNGKDRPPTVVLKLEGTTRIKAQVMAGGQLIRFTAVRKKTEEVVSACEVFMNYISVRFHHHLWCRVSGRGKEEECV
jgi:hypothetical protein